MSRFLLSLAQHYAAQEGTILLWSGGSHPVAQQSMLFVCPVEKVVARTWEELEGRLEGGIWAGYLGYEMGAVADADRVLPRLRAPTPDSIFYRYERVHTSAAGEETLPDALCPPLDGVTGLESEREYSEKVRSIQELIQEGELYQACLSHECWVLGERDPFQLFLRMARRSPAPFAAYLNCGPFSVVSASPERFVSRRGQELETRPIKGTAPRSEDPAKDALYRQHLVESEKERAELIMITDLMRNDLGRVSWPGSVVVDVVRQIEEHAGVYQALSVIRSQLRPGTASITALRHFFPPGSISGCPKLRAMEEIQQVERRPRGVYTGAIGYLWGKTRFDFNVAIRTVVAYPDCVSVALGGAIVADSDPKAEYKETLNKGRRIFEALGVG